MTDTLKEYCRQKVACIDHKLELLLPKQGQYPPVILEAMRYSVFAGGKRMRPVLLMAAADAVNGRGEEYTHVAAGLEMIHTYSLIHDDLPAMDDDDYRRGKPTNHKVYGEAMAILAGDALLTYAFEVMGRQPDVLSDVLLRVIAEIAAAVGPLGMVGGQAMDLFSEGKQIGLQEIEYLHKAKTGALFKASIRAGAMLAGAGEEQLQDLTQYSDYFGLAFQITDDILDVTGNQAELGKPVGSDSKNQKATYVSLYSVDKAKSIAGEAVDGALNTLKFFGPEADILRDLAKYLLSRNN
ncbi:polyprenyl synthetase family protein [Acetonema longum]|uniref:Farnesyl diphosphate synthase n=1 Tax=Acetonema longum DSM 6540 TaxID=1009370 RepID=F7NJY6_9FIRM|nr:farnesyl diphosphate synthase [Acetonema longum]EGO63633.1 geranylgeranyl pyrophosphate synthase [Acetonema longum DSM 6540]